MHLIQKLKLKSGPSGAIEPLEVQPSSITLFVGPNHSGKSLLLREINAAIPKARFSAARQCILQDIEFNPLDEEFAERLRAPIRDAISKSDRRSTVEVQLNGQRTQIHPSEFDESLAAFSTVHGLRSHFGSIGHNMANRLIKLLTGSERLSLLGDSARGDLRQPPGSTLGILFQDDTKRAELQRLIHAAFGWHLVIDPTPQNDFRAAASATMPPAETERSLSAEALEFYRDCGAVSEMSDGVRAFCGMLASIIVSEAHLIMIDEPEAFLHPALCTSLAKELCRQAQKNSKQLIIATHSAPFLLGCVQAGIDLNIVRLTYRKRVATSQVLRKEDLVPLMRQPLLRSVGALNGIFYESVIVTEADADRAFYDEVNHRCVAFEHPSGIPDCLFLNTQNWQTTARIVEPLRKLGVAAAAIVDIDILLEDKATAFQALLYAAGIPSATRTSLGQLRGDLRTKLEPRRADLKKRGIACASGEEKQSLEDFIQQLAAYGIFVVPCGELESWLPALSRPSSEKRDWLVNTFEAMGEDASHSDYLKPSEGDVWGFLGQLREWLLNPKRRGMPVH